MTRSVFTQTVGRAAERLPGLRRLPIVRLLVLGELVMLAREHFERLTPKERRRLVVLMRDARGRPSNLSARERRELEAIVAKAEPRLFATEAAGKISPVPLPGGLAGATTAAKRKARIDA
jgi:hypothetical protein